MLIKKPMTNKINEVLMDDKQMKMNDNPSPRSKKTHAHSIFLHYYKRIKKKVPLY